MSRENVEIVRRAYDAWNRAEPMVAADLLAPEIEWHLPPNFPESGTWRGRDQVVKGLASLSGSWDQLRVVVHELIDAGDRVVALVHFRGRAVITGLELEGAGVDAQVWTVRDGEVVDVQMHNGVNEGLEAVGLPAREET